MTAPNPSSAHAISIHQTSKSDPFHGHEYIARLCARFITHLLTYPEYPAVLYAFPGQAPLFYSICPSSHQAPSGRHIRICIHRTCPPAAPQGLLPNNKQYISNTDMSPASLPIDAAVRRCTIFQFCYPLAYPSFRTPLFFLVVSPSPCTHGFS